MAAKESRFANQSVNSFSAKFHIEIGRKRNNCGHYEQTLTWFSETKMSLRNSLIALL